MYLWNFILDFATEKKSNAWYYPFFYKW